MCKINLIGPQNYISVILHSFTNTPWGLLLFKYYSPNEFGMVPKSGFINAHCSSDEDQMLIFGEKSIFFVVAYFLLVQLYTETDRDFEFLQQQTNFFFCVDV